MKESIPLTWRRIPARYRLEGTVCETCGNGYFPPRSICPKCRRRGKIKPYTFSGKGKIISYSTVYTPPVGFEREVPYVLAIIELEKNARVTAEIVDAKEEDVNIGDEVELVFRKIQQDDPEGVIHYGYKFRLVKKSR